MTFFLLRRLPAFVLCSIVLFLCQGLTAQETGENKELDDIFARVPKAPPGVPVPPLPDQVLTYHTAEGMDIVVRVIAHGLDHPWGIASFPDGTMLVTERDNAQLRVIRNGELDPAPVAGLPEVKVGFWTGLLDVMPHPDYARNHLVYLTYNKPFADGTTATAVMRAAWDGRSLRNAQDVFVADPGTAGASSLLFGRDGMLYVSFYGAADDAQDLAELSGKVLRLTDDGKVPADNPFVNTSGARPEIFTFGHRTIQRMLLHPQTGAIWSMEMGPNGGDEVNILVRGANYGWPRVSLGRDYAGPWQGVFQQQGMVDPVVYWMPSISVSGMTFYTGEALPQWRGDLLVGGLRTGEIPATGRLERIRFNAKGEEIRREALLTDLHLRIRGAHQGTDGLVYLLTDEEDGAVLQISPAR